MKTLFLIFTFLFSLSLSAQGFGNQQGINTVTIAGRIINLSNPNVKVLNTVHNTTGFDVGKFVSGTATTNYVVPASTKAVILGFRATHISGTAGEIGAILYSDNVRDNTSTASTNPIYCGNGKTVATAGGSLNSVALQVPFDGFCTLVVPTGKYIHSEIFGVAKFNTQIYIGECADTGACEFHN